MTFNSNLSNTELLSIFKGIEHRIAILKQDDSSDAMKERQELFQKQGMILSILDDRYEEGKNRMLQGFAASTVGVYAPSH